MCSHFFPEVCIKTSQKVLLILIVRSFVFGIYYFKNYCSRMELELHINKIINLLISKVPVSIFSPESVILILSATAITSPTK